VSAATIAISLLGGIGLFLLGMRLMTDGLKLAAGESLKHILGTWTRTPWRGFLAGGLVTALVQSSSAVTVATIGFVNAGLLGLSRAVSVVFGSNVGTTMTSWIVALLGVKVQVGALAAPLVGAGALLRLIGGRSRRGPLGDAIAGFGLFFLGIEMLRGAFEGLGASVDLAAWALPGVAGVAIFVAVGFALTALTQSSSAAMALVLTAAAGGVVPLESAAAAAIGTNLGTTSTAALAAIGATPNARRVAAAHVLFNAAAAAAAVASLPLLLAAVARLRAGFGLEDTPVTAIALFHTTFNLLGVALVWPWQRRLVAFLEARFRSAEEDESVPRFLDRNVARTPDLAFQALACELARTRDLVTRMARAAVARGAAALRELELLSEALRRLFTAVGEFVADLARQGLPGELEELPPLALQVVRYQREAGNLALALARTRDDLFSVPPELAEAFASYEARLARVIEAAGADPHPEDAARGAQEDVEKGYEELKARLLGAAARGGVDVERLGALLDRAHAVRRLAEQLEKGARHLALLRSAEPEARDRE
jgi:phosphate:Na+ symporter